ncbi:hypothetical protein LWP59_34400 [Amycolatopsis acidiphila]|uniref:hypothetical protein n=1 Tax=Amycolatopsis acidiphila TaxID=715473 RepID=UPI0019BB1546|nr:hypothetical protein [Amycolatopsis acidiphila]UIJ59099.1 hypothetical protein LWP59_34400 [Amycolatopsis acidiphila]GHG98173.1 hypothetical protein GCM10017788_78110 [Amycolatopsis acidiphila]
MTNGIGARAFAERMLTMAPRERVTAGRKAWVTAWVPKRLTAQVAFEHGGVGEVVALHDAGVVDQHVQ